MALVGTIQINEGSIKPRPMDVFWGKREVSSITTVADSSGSLNDTYFEFSAPGADEVVVDYYAWFNINSAGTDPAISGKTGIEVAAATDATASAIATALQAALDADALLSASVSSNVVTLTNEYFGAVTEIADGASATGFTLASSVTGFGGSLGATTGGVELTAEPQVVDVIADQFGTTRLDQVITGTDSSVAMTLLEVSLAKQKLIIGQATGDSYTPVGGTELVGFGESKRFQNLGQYTGELILKPSGASDNLENYHFWKAYPLPESISFTGDALNEFPVTFNVFRDSSKPSEVSLFAFGDGTQDL